MPRDSARTVAVLARSAPCPPCSADRIASRWAGGRFRCISRINACCCPGGSELNVWICSCIGSGTCADAERNSPPSKRATAAKRNGRDRVDGQGRRPNAVLISSVTSKQMHPS